MSKYNDWTNLAGLAATVVRAREDNSRMQSEIHRTGANAAVLIAHAWTFAGVEDSEAKARGKRMIQLAKAITDDLASINAHVGKMQSEMKDAVAAIDEAEAKRKTTRGKLNI